MCDVKKMFVGLNKNAQALLLHLILNADESGNVECSERSLASDLGMGRQEVRTAKATLLATQQVTQQVTQGKTHLTLCCCGSCGVSKPTSKPNKQPRVQPNNQPNEKIEIAPEWVAQEYVSAFLDWVAYKKERREAYKSDRSLKACYSRLLTLAGNNPQTAALIVEQSMANGWKGLFPLQKQSNNGTDWRVNGRDNELAAQAVRMRTVFEAERNQR